MKRNSSGCESTWSPNHGRSRATIQADPLREALADVTIRRRAGATSSSKTKRGSSILSRDFLSELLAKNYSGLRRKPSGEIAKVSVLLSPSCAPNMADGVGRTRSAWAPRGVHCGSDLPRSFRDELGSERITIRAKRCRAGSNLSYAVGIQLGYEPPPRCELLVVCWPADAAGIGAARRQRTDLLCRGRGVRGGVGAFLGGV